MQTVKGQIETRLTDALNPDILEVEDFSHEHRGHASAPAGGESHFRVLVKAKALTGLSKIQQHRAVQAPLKDLIPVPIHALEIKIAQ